MSNKVARKLIAVKSKIIKSAVSIVVPFRENEQEEQEEDNLALAPLRLSCSVRI